jgi:hypothetical protein
VISGEALQNGILQEEDKILFSFCGSTGGQALILRVQQCWRLARRRQSRLGGSAWVAGYDVFIDGGWTAGFRLSRSTVPSRSSFDGASPYLPGRQEHA